MKNACYRFHSIRFLEVDATDTMLFSVFDITPLGAQAIGILRFGVPKNQLSVAKSYWNTAIWCAEE